MNYDEITKITATTWLKQLIQTLKPLRECFITRHGECEHCGLNSSQK